MNAKKCDRCGKFYDMPDTNPDIKVIQYIHNFGEKKFDLCDECQKKLEEFLKGEEK